MQARSLFAAIALTALLAACATPTTAPPAEPVAPTYSALGLEGVMGANARALIAEFGPADLDAREGPARKLQFLGPVCVLDAYLYPPRAGAEPVVTHVDARLPDGRDMDRASCVAALNRRPQAR
ncbi:MAG: hypothetical protein E6G92_14920 [Alphaproteobacteria bacterium]|nr:MAG: hypothetical protein E6G92_14920 [Alphaproteobacteria bacterium]